MTRVFCMLLVLCVLLSSCTGAAPFQNEELLRPPRLTEEQREIENALIASVNSENLTFKYPKSGEHRSAFIFQDIDGDSQDEALVFYMTNASDSTFLSVLDRMPDGKWYSPYAIGGPEGNVEFVEFAPMTDPSSYDILVGWSDVSGQQKRLAIYSYLNGRLENRLKDGPQSYETYLAADLDGDQLSELALISIDRDDRSHWLHLFAYNGFTVDVYANDVALSDYMMGCAGIISGRISQTDPRIGIFIDEILEDTLVTEVFVCERPSGEDNRRSAGKFLRNIIWEDMSDLSEDPPADGAGSLEDDSGEINAFTLYELTRRSGNTDICRDLNGDGIIEIPTGRLMPGYEDYDAADQIYLTQYKHLQNNALGNVYSAAINWNSGYQVEFPPSWVDHVTVVNQPENNEWRFIEYNSQLQNNPLEDWSSELMRIRVVSHKDYQDRSIENYTVLAVRGAFTYYAYIPETASGSLSITMEQLKDKMFSLTERKGVFET